MPANILLGPLGQPLTISNFPSPGINVSSYINEGKDNWNSELRTAPTSFTFDVLTRDPINNNPGADIHVTPYDPADYPPGEDPCSGHSACAHVIVDDGTSIKGTIWLHKDVFPQNSPAVQRHIVAHEIGHAFAQLNEHYDDAGVYDALRCQSVMGKCFSPIIDQPTDHDNGDVRDVFRLNGQWVANSHIDRVGANVYRQKWYLGILAGDKIHGESNYIVRRSIEIIYAPDFVLYSSASRNSEEMDGLNHLGNPLFLPTTITVQAGEHWCFRV